MPYKLKVMSKLQGISFFDRYLTLWVALCIIAGIAIGKLLPVVPDLNSGATLATVVGVLVEVPVMLTLVKTANNTRSRFS